MSKLTKEARAYCKEVVSTWSREDLVAHVEGVGSAAYDDDDDDDLVESVVTSIEAGDIDFDFSYTGSKAYPHHIQMMALDIEETWE